MYLTCGVACQKLFHISSGTCFHKGHNFFSCLALFLFTEQAQIRLKTIQVMLYLLFAIQLITGSVKLDFFSKFTYKQIESLFNNFWKVVAI